VTGDWRKLHNEELHNLYFSPNIIRVNKSRMMSWAGHVARIGEVKTAKKLPDYNLKVTIYHGWVLF
jgi:hypothetical protein